MPPQTAADADEKRTELRQAALRYHEFPTPGKIAIQPTKQLLNQRDLALAYSPGVAAPCEEIVKDPAAAFKYTSRGNLVAVITNGTAVLGLGDIGPLAAKPVMEGKGVLFKKFAGIDVFDIEINEKHDLEREARPRPAGGHHRGARADLRRHQPGRHQGARLLLCRAQAARAHEDPGVP
jgi:malate dehydrogenase (oxaloacetate-decarboxylating)(NADP+)